MNKRALVSAILAVTTATAYADPHKILVLQSEGRVDGGVKSKVDGAVLKLAKGLPAADVAPGDTSLSDAAAAVGCKPDTQSCREEIMGMLGVDELVYTQLTQKPGGVEVEVHRSIKGGSTTDAKQTLGSGAAADKLDGIAPLFGGAAKAPANVIVPPGTTTKPVEPTTTNVTTTTKPVEPATTTTTTTTPPETLSTTLTSEPTTPVVVTQPAGPAGPVDTGPSRNRQRLELAGMIGGGALVLIGFMCWGSASDIQSQIDEAPTATKPQLDALADLEARGDSYAAWGNVLFIGGAVLGGVSTYFFIKDRRARRHATSARITPTVFDHGAGLALSFGASP